MERNLAREERILYFIDLYCQSHNFNDAIAVILRKVVIDLMYFYDPETRGFLPKDPKFTTNWIFREDYNGYAVEDIIMNRIFLNVQNISISDNETGSSSYNAQTRTISIFEKTLTSCANDVAMNLESNLSEKIGSTDRKKITDRTFHSTLDMEYYKVFLEAVQTDFAIEPLVINDPANLKYRQFIELLLAEKSKRFLYYRLFSVDKIDDSKKEGKLKFLSINQNSNQKSTNPSANEESVKPLQPLRKPTIYNALFTPLLKEGEILFLVKPTSQVDWHFDADSYRGFYNVLSDNQFTSNYAAMMLILLGRERVFQSLYLNNNTPIQEFNEYLKMEDLKNSEDKKITNSLEIISLAVIPLVKKCLIAYSQERGSLIKLCTEEEIKLMSKLIDIYAKRLEYDYDIRYITTFSMNRIREEIDMIRKMIIRSKTKEQAAILPENAAIERSSANPELDKLYDKLDTLEKKYCQQFTR